MRRRIGDRWVRGATLQREIAALDAQRDDREIYHLAMEVLYGDPHFAHAVFLITFARQAAVPDIARVLYRNGRGDIVVDPGKRNDATMTFFGRFVRDGYDTPEGIAAIELMERIHSRFPIDNADKLYTLATILLEPERQIDIARGRQFTPQIHEAAWRFWHGVADRMGLSGLPPDRAAFKQWMLEYEREHYAYTEAGHRIALALLDDWTRWFPGPLKEKSKQMIIGVMDDDLRVALGMPEPEPWARRFMHWRGRTYLRCAPYRIAPRGRNWVDLWGRRHFGKSPRLPDVGHAPNAATEPADAGQAR